MADNILRNDVEVTFKTFLEGVYAGRSKPFLEAAFRIGYGIFRGGSTLLSSIVRAVHPDNRDPDRDKEMRERCSEWLSRDVDDPKKREPRDIGFARPVNAWLRRRYLERVGRDAGVAFDNSDISKLYGGARRGAPCGSGAWTGACSRRACGTASGTSRERTSRRRPSAASTARC